MKQKGGFVYILTNKNHTVLYTGVSASLLKRAGDHRAKINPDSFSAKFNANKLVYFKFYESIATAIAEEKRIKAGSRKKKLLLIKEMNPQWKDLYEQLEY